MLPSGGKVLDHFFVDCDGVAMEIFKVPNPLMGYLGECEVEMNRADRYERWRARKTHGEAVDYSGTESNFNREQCFIDVYSLVSLAGYLATCVRLHPNPITTELSTPGTELQPDTDECINEQEYRNQRGGLIRQFASKEKRLAELMNADTKEALEKTKEEFDVFDSEASRGQQLSESGPDLKILEKILRRRCQLKKTPSAFSTDWDERRKGYVYKFWDQYDPDTTDAQRAKLIKKGNGTASHERMKIAAGNAYDRMMEDKKYFTRLVRVFIRTHPIAGTFTKEQQRERAMPRSTRTTTSSPKRNFGNSTNVTRTGPATLPTMPPSSDAQLFNLSSFMCAAVVNRVAKTDA